MLTLDGGGMKGLVLAIVLDAIQKRTGLPISRCFDLICGTSAGGVAAINLAYASPPSQGLDDFRACIAHVRTLLQRRSQLKLMLQGKWTLASLSAPSIADRVPPIATQAIKSRLTILEMWPSTRLLRGGLEENYLPGQTLLAPLAPTRHLRILRTWSQSALGNLTTASGILSCFATMS